ncbi:PfaB family protein [Moorena producens JHB]|uniref:PfaB family protein n=1 Tax=Moorena producens (strain JHB) TaxID=1454205 RepID=A0A1D9FZD6_MOOP1|nr:PfaB family protein [Moorena producens]AOY80727.1 PfaB family protein [Moorena producens JHB]
MEIAIVGMDAVFGSCQGLDKFAASIYDGSQHFHPIPHNRYQGREQNQQLPEEVGGTNGALPQVDYFDDFDINAFNVNFQSNEDATLNYQQLLLTNVVDNALKDAGFEQGNTPLQKVAVITSLSSGVPVEQRDSRLHLDRVLEESLSTNKMVSDSEQLSVLKRASSGESGYAIANSNLWNISGPTFTVEAAENSVIKALDIAKILLKAGEVEAVVVGAVNLVHEFDQVLLSNGNSNTGEPTLSFDYHANGSILGEGAGAVVLKRAERAKQDQNRIYAVIDGINWIANSAITGAESVKQSCQQAFEQAGVKPRDIGYLEVFGSGVQQQDRSEIQGLIAAYQGDNSQLSCCLGSVKYTIGHTYIASGIASLIKTALCLYHRYIPATPNWSKPKQPELWKESPFYVANESRPWFLTQGQVKRVAAINSLAGDGSYGHLILSEELSETERSNGYLEQAPFYLFPIAANDHSALLEQLDVLEQTIENSSSLSQVANQTFAKFKVSKQATYTLAIVGGDKAKVMREIERSRPGIKRAFAEGKPWKSPLGSYFTANPLGKKGAIAFVYPGAFNSYIGMGRKLFQLFPSIYDRAASLISNPGEFFREKQLYPRSQHQLSKRELEDLETKLGDTPLSMLETGTGFAVLFTQILRDYFQVQPQAAFGYSMGESTMMYALDVWSNADYGSNFVNSSELFRSRLAGAQNAVRDHWGMTKPPQQDGTELWSSYVLMAPASTVKECLKQENRVYLTHINTPTEVVIAGDAQGCKRVIEALDCDSFRSPTNLVLHCEAMASEYNELSKLNSVSVNKTPDIVFYSSASYTPIPLDQNSIANHLAQGVCQELDFPRLINRAYDDGAKLFIELGSGGTCTRWISDTLKHQDHLALCINPKRGDDLAAVVKVLAQLVSHQVSLNLSPLYSSVSQDLPKCPLNPPILGDFDISPMSQTSVSETGNQYKLLETKLTSDINKSGIIGANLSQSVDFNSKPVAELSQPMAETKTMTLVKDQIPSQEFTHQETVPVNYPAIPETSTNIIFNADDVLEFTEGKVSRVFGKDFESIDAYARRVRLPSPPYLFISRVTKLEGERENYKTGVIETEYDLPENAWYAVDGQVPLGICKEAGHGILLLLSYLGSDFENKGKRSFRLLDLTATFLDNQPEAIKTLRYEVRITSHVITEDSLLIFFKGECWIGDQLWMTLDGGCAGLFSDEELALGQGIVSTEEDNKALNSIQPQHFQPLLSCEKLIFDQQDLLHLSQGNIAACFGSNYQQQGNPSLRLPPEKLLMIDRVIDIDPQGGAAGLGLVMGTKSVTPEDWYFLCHFKNDPTMPGSLMVEGSCQLLQFYLLFLGLQTRTVDARFQPIAQLAMSSRFRGQVTPGSGTLVYQLEITEIGLSPQPFASANVDIIFAGKTIAAIKNLGLQLSEKQPVSQKQLGTLPSQITTPEPPALFSSEQLKELAEGSVTRCLGPEFQIYDNRRCVRVPNNEFCLISRVLEVEGKRHELQPNSTITTNYDVSPTAWFYNHNSYPYLPYCAYIEIAGQPCIFLGVHLGTTLLFPDEDLYFRNLDGEGKVLKDIDLRGKTITDKVTMLSSTAVKGAIIQKFDFQLFCDGEEFYQGNMVFGYFSHQVLANQVGLDNGKLVPPWYEQTLNLSAITINLNAPENQQKFYQAPPNKPHYRLAHSQLDFLDDVMIIEAGGKYQKGYIYASTEITPNDWFFSRHFYQDPVMPGALGVEAILQAMQVYALQLDLGKSFKSPRFGQVLNHQITWKYRGQITPENRKMFLEVHISSIEVENEQLKIIGDASLWKDNMRIYEIKDIAIGLLEA